MLDVHVVTATGSATALTEIPNIAAGGDKATVAGVPIGTPVTLVRWGIQAVTTGPS